MNISIEQLLNLHKIFTNLTHFKINIIDYIQYVTTYMYVYMFNCYNDSFPLLYNNFLYNKQIDRKLVLIFYISILFHIK